MPLRNRKIGIFTQAWDFGGVCSFCHNLGRGLARAGYDVTLILTRAYKRDDSYARLAFERLAQIDAFSILDLKLHRLPRFLRNEYLKRRVSREGFDAIFLNNPDHFLGAFEEMSTNERLISVTHGDLASGTYRTFASTQRFCHRHIAISTSIYENLVSMCAPEVHKLIHLINHGVAPSPQPPVCRPDSALSVVYCGRFDLLQKRISDIPQAWKTFLQNGGQGVLHLIGAGEGEALLRRELHAQIQAGSVIMHGYLAPAEIPAVLQQSEVVLNLSNWEGLPLSILEGMANGCYPLLSNIRSGHADIVASCGGTFFQTGDVAQVAQILGSFSRNKERLFSDRCSAWKHAQTHFGEARMLARYGEILDSL